MAKQHRIKCFAQLRTNGFSAPKTEVPSLLIMLINGTKF